jgi:hypothetical protein
MHGMRLERVDRPRRPNHQRRIAKWIESEALDRHMDIFPAPNSLCRNWIAASDNRYIDTDGCEMGDDQQPMAKKVGAIVANHEDPISGSAISGALEFRDQVFLTLGIPPAHLPTLDHVAFRGLPLEGWTVPKQTATQISHSLKK